MPAGYKAPGVYVEEIAKFPPSIAGVETAIPAFIGYTQIAAGAAAGDLLLKPKRITSIAEYEANFGLPQREENIAVTINVTTRDNGVSRQAAAQFGDAARSLHILYYALQLYFANGGGPCYIVSVGGYKALGEPLVPAELEGGLTAIEKEDEPTLIVIPEAQSLGIADFKRLMDLALSQCARLRDRFVIMDVHGDTMSMSDSGANLLDGLTNFRAHGVGTDNLEYGASYAPNIETILDFACDEAQTQVTIVTDGIAAAPVSLGTLQTQPDEYARAKAALADVVCTLPPSAAIAGIYAWTDSTRGVWKAPANASLSRVIKPAIKILNTEQDQMNVDPLTGKSVNAIRSFQGKGTLVWGARTLKGNDNEWRYVNVRRLCNFVEESVSKSTMQFVFEPNDANTWVRVRAMIENFLTLQWRAGALQGAKPEQAFYVAVGLGKTMTANDLLEGRLIVEIGLATVRPAEFIVLRFSHMMAAS